MPASLTSVLLLGLLAGGVTCAAAQGGLLAGLVARRPGPGPGAAPARLRDDLAPVGGFLAGKLLSHTALGLLLGLLGTAARPGPQLRASVQLAAGVLIIAMGLGQLGVPGLGRLSTVPAWTRPARGAMRSASTLAPAALGLATILIPCGATLTVMALAVTSVSPWHGAAVMAVFVLGTAPLFTVLGYAATRARRAAGSTARRLATATGALIIVMGAYTLNGALELTGSPISASALAHAADPTGQHTSTTDRVTVSGGRQTVLITATGAGYRPGELRISAGLPTTLTIRAERAHGCVRTFVIPALGIETTLPADGDTVVELGPLAPGPVAYACAMGMYTGRLIVTEDTP